MSCREWKVAEGAARRSDKASVVAWARQVSCVSEGPLATSRYNATSCATRTRTPYASTTSIGHSGQICPGSYC